MPEVEQSTMATNDIYDSETKYRKFKENLNDILNPPNNQEKKHNRVYFCQNPENIEYFKKLFLKFEAEDLSFVRRLRLLQVLKTIVHNTTKNLKDLTRDDVDAIVACANNTMRPKTVSDFKVDLKHIWKKILPDKDEKGRLDESIMPYVVRHLKTNIDKSKQVARKDRLTWNEFEKTLAYFSDKPCIQAYLMIGFESLARPQELLWRKIKDIELYDNYAKIMITDHGKEGIGILQCIDSYAYLTTWLNLHPFKNNPESFLFVNKARKQFKPAAINKHLRIACQKLGINKPVTCYSIKRNGVTFRRLRGDSDVEIQHAARWTSTEQLKTYDMSRQEDAFRLELIKRGILPAEKGMEHLQPKTKPCSFCHAPNKFIDITCSNCNRPLDRQKIAELEHEKEIRALNEFMSFPQIQELFKTVYELKRQMQAEIRVSE